MHNYSFTCGITGCGVIMKAQGEDKEEAVGLLVQQAKEHLRVVHPDVHKSDEEINQDIRTNTHQE